VTDGLDQALANAGLALLTADVALTVYDGVAPNPTPDVGATPYVLVYTTIDRPADDPDSSLDGTSDVWLARWICHCVGATPAAARAIAQRVRTQLLDQRPVVTGLACGLIRLEQSQPPTKDETTGGAVLDAVEVYRLKAKS
jgi:hypothetical protein